MVMFSKVLAVSCWARPAALKKSNDVPAIIFCNIRCSNLMQSWRLMQPPHFQNREKKDREAEIPPSSAALKQAWVRRCEVKPGGPGCRGQERALIGEAEE